MRRHILFILLTLTALSVRGQLTPVHNVASPEAGTLGMFGTVPVSHYTGQPDISIPLYELKVGDFTLPLTARYHLASVKPHTPPTTLGLGWVLDAGGYISRTVRGIMDEQHGSQETTAGFYENCSRMNSVTPDNFVDMLVLDAGDMPLGDDPTAPERFAGELAADEFSFSFCGHSGNFYRNSDGGWTVVSDEDIRVEFDETGGFMPLDSLDGRIATSQWGNREVCNRFFRMFTLVTPDGYRWVFGGADATEFSINYYHRDENDLVPTTWRLSKVITPEGRVISLKYDTNALMCRLTYTPQSEYVIVANSASQSGAVSYNNDNTGLKGYTGFLLFPASLKQIVSPNETLDFEYFNDPAYGLHYYYYGHKALGWSNVNDATRRDVYSSSFKTSAHQFLSLLPTIDDPDAAYNENLMRMAVARSLKSPLLHRIAVKDRAGVAQRSIYFDYDMTGRSKLSMITAREGSPKLIDKYRFVPDGIGNVLLGKRVPVLTDQEITPATYHFCYNKSHMLLSRVLAATDAWGYYSGGNQSLSSFPVFGRSTPNLHGTLAETLSTIIYPTGGQTQFKFELNDYSRELSQYRTTLSDPSYSKSTAGGLRVKELINKDKDGNVVNSIRYYYTDSIGSRTSSGILQNKPVYRLEYHVVGRAYIRIDSSDSFGQPSTNHNTPDVGYSCVIEQTSDAEGNTIGHTRYRYSNFDTDIFGESHLDEAPICSARVNGESPVMPFTSRSQERGKLIQKEVFDADGQLKLRERVRYANTSDDYLTTAYHSRLSWCKVESNNFQQYAYTIFGWLNKTYTYSCLPVERHITEYYSPSDSLTRSTYLTYNAHKMTASDSTVSSTNGTVTTRYRYVCDDAAGRYAWMRRRHFLSAKTSVHQLAESQTRTDSIEYGLCTGNDTIPYISKVTGSINNGPVQTLYEVLETDNYGNPVRLTEKGVPSYLQWCHEGQRLRQRKTGTLDDNTSCESIPVSSYLYDSSLRLQTAKEPSQPMRHYQYDAYGRLIQVKSRENDAWSEITGNDTTIPIRTYYYDYRKTE